MLHRINAKKWLELAISKNKLVHFVLGVPPYAKQSVNEAGEREPVLAPNLQVLYDYHKEHPEFNLDRAAQTAVFQMIENMDKGDPVICSVLWFITVQLCYEKQGRAAFCLDCQGILDALREKVRGKQKTTPEIVFYDSHLREQYGVKFL